jgi:hypothetical protein
MTRFLAAFGLIHGPVLASFLAAAAPLLAAGRVELEIVSEPRTAVTAAQGWARALGQAGVQSVRFRQGTPGDTLGIRVSGTEQSPVYVVTGVLTAADELALPGARFRLGDAAGVARWLDDVAQKGPPDRRPAKSAFGLDVKQFEQLHADLARPVAFSTKGASRAEVLQRIAVGLRFPLQLPAPAAQAMKDDKVSEELAGLSAGTAVACVLRPMGYCMVPEAASGQFRYTVVQARPNLEVWPIGWPSDKPRKEVLPGLYEFLNVNIQGVTVAEALDAIAKRLKVRYLIDHNALARHGIDPAKVQASLPQSRTFYAKALDRVLFQAGLKSELRVDEAGKPLLWITSVKAM